MVQKERCQRFDDRTVKYMFVGYMTAMNHYLCFEPNTRRDHLTGDIVFHELNSYYENVKEKLQRVSPSSPDHEKSTESKSNQEHETITAKPK